MKSTFPLMPCIICLFVPRVVTAEEPAWRNLPLVSEGKIESHWRHLWGGGFAVMEDGSLRTDCTDAGMGLLWYSAERFGDCQIRIVYRAENPASNAGVYVRIDDGIADRIEDPLALRERNSRGRLTPQTTDRLEAASAAEREAWYPVHHGFEVQICDSADEYHRTGAIYSLAAAPAVAARPTTEWRTMIITLSGTKIAVEVDGQPMSTFDSAAPDLPARKHWSEPKREHTRPTKGFIGLQNHDPGDVVYFREVSVRALK